jgi:hypothetical protein
VRIHSALVVVFVLFCSATARSQIATGGSRAFTCLANASVPPLLRAEGITELVGDVLLNCTGGSPTAAGAQVPFSNIQVFLNTNVTSRIVGAGNLSEAALLIDEPFPANPIPNNASPASGAGAQLLCGSTGAPFTSSGSSCAVTGTGTGIGIYSGASGRPNIFQSYQVAANSVAWLGVPIDAPGPNGVRVIRITNIRANASQLGISSTLIPTQIVMFIAINGSQQVTINNPQLTVGFLRPGLTASISPVNLNQCNFTGTFNVTVTEGFADSFKRRNIAVSQNLNTLPAPLPQNVPGYAYFTETGFYNPAATGSAGLADTGTRIMVRFNSIGNGVTLFVPTIIALTGGSTNLTYPGVPGGGISSGFLVLVSTDVTQLPFTSSGQVAVTGNSGIAVYEVISSDPNAIESATIPVTVAFSTTSDVGPSTVNVSFSPISTAIAADSTSPIPRFADFSSPKAAFTIVACTCNVLFPFVTNQAGFDTGITIGNTSLDPFGTLPQMGTVTLNYYGSTTGGGAAPAPQTSQAVPAGSQLVFTLSGGGNLGISSTPGFQGYVIATARFQYCHAFAFISDLGASRLAEGYLGIILDALALNRTGVGGENQGQ